MANNDKINSGGDNASKANKVDKISAKSKNIRKLSKIRKSAKVRCLEQPIFLKSKASSIFFMKDNSD